MVLEAITLFSTVMMTGLIWFVQLVHYPLFKEVSVEDFVVYEKAHTAKTGFLVAPLMLIELGSGLLFWWMHSNNLLNHLALIMLILIWLSTFFIQVPLHNRLSKAHNVKAINRLIHSNWIRTVCWSVRSLCLLVIIFFSN